MSNLTRFVIGSAAGLILALTASPALAAHTDDGNGAHVEHRELVFPDGTYEYRTVTRHHGGYYYTTNARDQWTYQDDSLQSSFDWKTHYNELENVTKLSSQATSTENGETCRTNFLSVVTKGETRKLKEEFCD
jgi:hypothetical protein